MVVDERVGPVQELLGYVCIRGPKKKHRFLIMEGFRQQFTEYL